MHDVDLAGAGVVLAVGMTVPDIVGILLVISWIVF